MGDEVRRTVLLIHDQPEVLERLAAALRERGGFEVRTSTSAVRAIKELRELAPDVVAARDRMPLLSGPHLLRALAAVDPELPVVLFSDQGDLQLVVERMRAGALDLVLDPLSDPGALVAAVERGASRTARRRSARRVEEGLREAQVRMTRLLEQDAVIRERAFEAVGGALERASRELFALQRELGPGALGDRVRSVFEDVQGVIERLQTAHTDASRTSSRSVRFVDFHPLTIAEQVRDATIRELHRRGVEFSAFVPVDLPPFRGDPGQLQACLVQLVRFLAGRRTGGGIHVEMSVESRGPGPWVVRFDLTDAEPGHTVEGPDVIDRYLPGDDAANVREEFLDLSLAARAVAVLGGSLAMFEGAGCARLSFDLALLTAKTDAAALGEPGLAEGDVLVVEARPHARRALANELRRAGMRVASFGTAEAGVQALVRAAEQGALPRVVFLAADVPGREQVEAEVDGHPWEARPEVVYLGRGGQFAPAGRESLFLVRPPTRKVLLGILERYVGPR